VSPHDINQLGQFLPALILFALPSFALFIPVWSGKVPALRLASAGDRREPALWTLAETILCLVVWYFGQLFFGAMAAPLLDLGWGIPAVALLGQVAGTLATAGFTCHVVLRVIGQPAGTLGLARTRCSSYVGAMVCIVLAFIPLQAVSVLWTVVLHDLGGFALESQDVVREFREYARQGDAVSMICFAAAGVIVAPIGEELLFRGVLHGYLREHWGRLPGAILSGAAFAAVHRSLLGFAPLMILGVLLARIYDRSGSLYPAMLFHAAFNATSLALLSLSP
jgi:membrane protease YdiL (CAAX protease family)